MKKLTAIFIILHLLFNINILSQEPVSPYKGSIIAGTNRMFIISIKQHESVKAKILSIDGERIMIKEKNGNTREIIRSTITNIEDIPFGTLGNVGVGFGIPYGVLGFNLELNLLPYLSVTGGFGTTIFSGVGYNVGLKGYLRKPGSVWRPRASVYYGINGMYAVDFDHPDNEKYSGITVGLGQLFMWGQHGFDLDIMYLIDSQLYDAHPEENFGKIKISIGYKFAF